MAGNTFGQLYRLTSFGESHGVSIGGIIDGCPAGLDIDLDHVQNELDRRRPGQSSVSTERNEQDRVEFVSGVFEGKTTGTPIGFQIKNKDAQSKDYSELKNVYRPSHADYTYQSKYGIRDHRGGGRSSARETATRIVAGAIAKQILTQLNIKISAYVKRVHDVEVNAKNVDWSQIEKNIVRCPHEKTAQQMIAKIEEAKNDGDSLGGAVKCVIQGLPVGLGEPVFDKYNAEMAKAMMSINATKYFEIGAGKNGTFKKGSELNDAFEMQGDTVRTSSNNSGGIQGGLTNGEDVEIEVGFKPTATIAKSQATVNNQNEEVTLSAKGRHDPCVLPRAVPIVEAMAAMVTLDMYLRNQSTRMDQIIK